MLAYEPGLPHRLRCGPDHSLAADRRRRGGCRPCASDARQPRGSRGRRRHHRRRHRPHAFRGHARRWHFPVRCNWDQSLVAASIADRRCALGGRAARLARVGPPPGARGSRRRCWRLAICGLHFTAMGAVVITPDPTMVVAWLQHRRLDAGHRGDGRHASLVMLAVLAMTLITSEGERDAAAHATRSSSTRRWRVWSSPGRHDRQRQSPHPAADARTVRGAARQAA